MHTDSFSPCIYATVATTVANTQPLCYTHGKNGYMRNITWKQKFVQNRFRTIKAHYLH